MNTVKQEHPWVKLAEAKLIEVRVDTSDVDAVRDALSRCVGGRRLFQLWAEVHTPMKQLELPIQENYHGS